MEFKSQRKQTFEYDRPKVPDMALFQIEKLDFGKDKKNPELTTCSGYAKIIDSVNFPDNIDMGMPLFFGLHLVNDKPFKIEQFMGFLEAVTGDTPPVDRADYFDDVRIQDKIQKGLPNMLFAASIIENVYVDKKMDKKIENVQFEEFYTKQEFMEAKSKKNSGSGVAVAAAETGAPATAETEKKGFF
jgi:hypothetical protein